MYDELLPYWKTRCRCEPDTVHPHLDWTVELNRRGIYHEHQTLACDVKGAFEWVKGASGNYDCLVLGIMLFTWEAGIGTNS